MPYKKPMCKESPKKEKVVDEEKDIDKEGIIEATKLDANKEWDKFQGDLNSADHKYENETTQAWEEYKGIIFYTTENIKSNAFKEYEAAIIEANKNFINRKNEAYPVYIQAIKELLKRNKTIFKRMTAERYIATHHPMHRRRIQDLELGFFKKDYVKKRVIRKYI